DAWTRWQRGFARTGPQLTSSFLPESPASPPEGHIIASIDPGAGDRVILGPMTSRSADLPRPALPCCIVSPFGMEARHFLTPLLLGLLAAGAPSAPAATFVV